ncbi:MAG: hypothetical protein ACI9LO_001278 [Planctomycetota bacterium]|jgi:hypothetical protein
MINNPVAKAALMSTALLFSASASAIGQEGDSRIQANGSFILANTGDDTIFASIQLQTYASDTLAYGFVYSITESGGFSTVSLGGSAKAIFPSESEAVPYVGAQGLFLASDTFDELVFGVSAGADFYFAENAGYNFDVTQGLTSDFYEDTTFSFGLFYEF